MFAGIILIWSWERKSGVEWSVECRRAVGKVVFNLITQSSRQSGPKVAGQLEFEAKRNESGENDADLRRPSISAFEKCLQSIIPNWLAKTQSPKVAKGEVKCADNQILV